MTTSRWLRVSGIKGVSGMRGLEFVYCCKFSLVGDSESFDSSVWYRGSGAGTWPLANYFEGRCIHVVMFSGLVICVI